MAIRQRRSWRKRIVRVPHKRKHVLPQEARGRKAVVVTGAAMVLVVCLLAAVSRVVGQRTRDPLAVKRAQGVRLGRPQMVPADLVARIRTAHQAGAGWSALARQLNADRVATAHGGTKWYPSTVRAVVMSAGAAA